MYPPPVDQLLQLGAPIGDDEFRSPPGCYAALGISAVDGDALLRLALDPALNDAADDSAEVWGPLHAWRALCELHVADAILPLTQLWENDDGDWQHEDLIELLPDFGAAAVGPMLTVLDDPQRNQWAQCDAACVLERIAQRHSELRVECVALLAERLGQFDSRPESVNTSLMNALVELKAVECAPLIQRAFDAGVVDRTCRGDWVDVEFELGLTTVEPQDRARRMRQAHGTLLSDRLTHGMTADERTALRKQRAKAEKKAQQKRKQAKLNRKRNR